MKVCPLQLLNFIRICTVFLFFARIGSAEDSRYFEIEIIDTATSRGIPLVELTTTNSVKYVTDNLGRIAYHEAGHANQQVFFEVVAQGYQVPQDGFGIKGLKLLILPGRKKTVSLKRDNLAERLYRITGEGRYRDSILLNYEIPPDQNFDDVQIVGQDSVQVAKYKGKLQWFWGDTSRLSYPLGMFRTAGAISPVPEESQLQHSQGLQLDYFKAENGFVRPMVELPEQEGVVWVDGVCTVQDHDLNETLIAHYSRRAGLVQQLAHGMVVYDDSRKVFTKKSELSEEQNWQHLSNHPVKVTEDGISYLQSGTPFPLTRVPANLDAIMDPAAYESWSCVAGEDSEAKPLRNSEGQLDWQWRKTPPVAPKMEARWLKNGLIKSEEAIISPVDESNTDRHLQIHTGNVHWNEHRQRWIMIASEINLDNDNPSHLGEVWYSESTSPQGPYRVAVKILTHNKQSFYNACHHPFLNEKQGRVIYFEGTYTNMFTNSPPTPRYNYNQIMYRLDLNSEQIEKVFGKVGK